MENVKLFSGYEKIKMDSKLNPLLVPTDGEVILEYIKNGFKCVLKSKGDVVISDLVNNEMYNGVEVEKINDKILAKEILYIFNTNTQYKIVFRNSIQLIIYDKDNVEISERYDVDGISTNVDDIIQYIDRSLTCITLDFNYLEGKILKDVIVNKNEDCIDFIIDEGYKLRMQHGQECCEHVYIDDICGDIKDIIGNKILSAYESSNSMDEADKDKYDTDNSATWTFYSIATMNGFVNIRWIGTSNGCYSESVDLNLIIGDVEQ